MPDTTALSLERFSALVDRYAGPLTAFLSNLVRERELARDLLQDTFADAWHAAQQLKPPLVTGAGDQDIRRWLYCVAYRHAISALRRHRIIRWESLDDASLPEIEAARFTGSFEDRLAEKDALTRALAKLTAQDVASLTLIVVQGFTAAEAAQIVGTSAQTVAKRAARAKRRLVAIYVVQDAETSEEARS